MHAAINNEFSILRAENTQVLKKEKIVRLTTVKWLSNYFLRNIIRYIPWLGIAHKVEGNIINRVL